MKKLANNLNKIQQELSTYHLTSPTAKLIAVTKYVESDVMRELYHLGQYDIAENRTDLLLKKKIELADCSKFVWHFIGPLQTRKVKDVINNIDYFHALDRLKTAQEIQKRAEHEIKCFIQVNVSGETTKQGISPDALVSFIDELEKYDKIRVVGLMTMAPNTSDKQLIRNCFKQLKDLSQDVQSLNKGYAPCTELSMGMSQDYQIALEEGATFIRIGTDLFQ